MKRSYTSEQLGRVGESDFASMCRYAKWTINKADEDLEGWDYYVQFPDDNPNVSLDLTQPFGCFFQIKTLWLDNDRIKCKLSTLEPFIKQPSPTFICALKYVEDENDKTKLKVSESYIIHFDEELCSDVLKRLRKATAENRLTLNKQYFSLSVKSYGKKFNWNAADLIKTIKNKIGRDYVTDKTKWLSKTGFGENRYTINGYLKLENVDQLDNAMLGLNHVELAIDSIIEKRFDIDIDITKLMKPDKAKFSVVSGKSVKLSFLDASKKENICFSAECFKSSITEDKKLRLVFKFGEINLKLNNVSKKINISMNCSVDTGTNMSIEDIWKYYNLIKITNNCFYLEIDQKIYGTLIQKKYSKNNISNVDYSINIIKNLRLILVEIGYSDIFNLNINSLVKEEKNIELLYRKLILKYKYIPIKLELLNIDIKKYKYKKLKIINKISFYDISILYALTTVIKDRNCKGNSCWLFDNVEVTDVELIRNVDLTAKYVDNKYNKFDGVVLYCFS